MKLIPISRVAASTAVLFMLSLGTELLAQPKIYRAYPIGCKVRLEGTSTAHAWAVETTLVNGSMELPADFPLDPSKPMPATLSAAPKVHVDIPVSQMRSDKNSTIMDDRMKKELNYSAHPQITYRLTEMKPVKAEGGKLNFDTKGELTVAGATHVISMPVTFEPQTNNRVKVSGSVAMKMTDFKIDPPEFGVGGVALMKTGNDIKVIFEWLLRPAAAASTEKK